MPDIVTLQSCDCTHDLVKADSGILQELSKRFTFFAENYKYSPKYKQRVWDGKIRLMSPFNPYLYVGLREEVAKFCRANGYDLRFEGFDPVYGDLTVEEANEFLSTLNLPKELNGIPFEPRDYQVEAFVRAYNRKRQVLICPTASGKSFIGYAIIRAFEKKTLVIVPNLGLIRQMKSDFVDYGYDPDLIHQIYSGQEKDTGCPVVVSTWQSMKSMPESYLQQFEVLIVDEVHGAKATELKGIIERMKRCEIRIGMTGTLDGIKANELTITGLLGPIHKVISTKELMDQGRVAKLKIQSVILEHTEENKRLMAKAKYPDEMRYLIESEARNRFIRNLAMSLKGNTLVLFQFVEKHGEPLYEAILRDADCPVLYVSGRVEADEREEVRKFVNAQTQSITVASKGVFATGVNIPNIDSIIFASPSKARIQTLQAIGRGLRLSDRKTECTLYDVADDLSWKSWTNHTLNHYVERVKIYKSEKFVHRAFPVKLKD